MKEIDGLSTTVVGSLPLRDTPGNMYKGFKDMIEAGIDYPCYPQLKSMLSSFLDPLSEIIDPLKKVGHQFYLESDFKIPNKTIGFEYGNFINDFFKKYPDLKDKIQGTKACLTGPFTLASEIILRDSAANDITPIIFNEPRAIMVDKFVERFAEIARNIAKLYNDMGINIISLDDPILSVIIGRKSILHDDDFIIRILNKSISEIKNFSSIHVCGRISPKLRDILLSSKVKILDHEFCTSESNFEIFKKEHFETTDKYLAMGSVKTNIIPLQNGTINDYVEDIEYLINHIKKGIREYGKDNLIIKPDCGFAPLRENFGEKLGYEIVLKKLKNMVLATQKIK